MNDITQLSTLYSNAIARAEKAEEAERKLTDVLKAIKRHGELACVDAHPGSYFNPGGKKPATKEVFQFPRHMLTELDAAIETPPEPLSTTLPTVREE